MKVKRCRGRMAIRAHWAISFTTPPLGCIVLARVLAGVDEQLAKPPGFARPPVSGPAGSSSSAPALVEADVDVSLVQASRRSAR